MSPQPRNTKEDEKQPTAEDVASDKKTPEVDESKPVYTVERYKREGDAILGFHLADVRAALGSLPDSRELNVADAKARVADVLNAPVKVDVVEQPARAL